MSRWPWHHRSPTPPPIKHPIVDNDDDNSTDDDETDSENGKFSWFYAPDAGGMVLNFGKHRGQKIHDTSISYLYWCFRTFKYNHPVLEAFKIYLAGLEEYAKTAYDAFVVPFGRKHKGKTIRQCRDKKWLQWTIRQKVLTNKYTIFFVAVQYWLENPRHYEVTRDIGESLRRSEYEDGIDLSGLNEYEEDPTLSDDDGDESNNEDDEGGYNSEDDWDGVPTQADLDFIDDGPVEDGVSSNDEQEFGDASPGTQKKRKSKKYKQKRSAESRFELDREFIVPDDDDEIHDSEDYITSDTESDCESPRRVTRSATKKLLEKQRKAPVSPTNSTGRFHKRSTLIVSLSDNENNSVSGTKGRSPFKRSHSLMLVKSDGGSEEDHCDSDSAVEFVEPHDVSPKPSWRRGSPKASDSEEEEEEEILFPAKHCKARVVNSLPESEGEMEEENDDEPQCDIPITPRSRFLNRKRAPTSDSETDEASTRAGKGSPRKKTRARRRLPPSQTEVGSDSESDVFTVTPRSGRLKGSHLIKGNDRKLK